MIAIERNLESFIFSSYENHMLLLHLRMGRFHKMSERNLQGQLIKIDVVQRLDKEFPCYCPIETDLQHNRFSLLVALFIFSYFS